MRVNVYNPQRKKIMIRIEIENPGPADAQLMMALARSILGEDAGPTVVTLRQDVDLSGVVKDLIAADGRPRTHTLSTGVQVNVPTERIAEEDLPSTGLAAASDVFGKEPLPNGAVPVNSGAAVPSATPPTPQPIVPAPPSAASIAPPPGAPIPAPGTAQPLDADGLPWDHRIHVESKAINKGDGKWKAKRGVDAGLVAAVQAEHRAILGVAAPNPFANLKTAGELGIGSPAPSPVPAVPPVPSQPPVPPVPVAASTTPAAPSGAQPVISFQELIPKVTAALTAKTIDQAKVLAVLSAHGVATLPGLMAHPHLVAPVAVALGLA